jgi:TPR repeat protein
MSQDNFIKMDCYLCGNSIEFLGELADHVIVCPHCQKEIRLSAAKTPAPLDALSPKEPQPQPDSHRELPPLRRRSSRPLFPSTAALVVAAACILTALATALIIVVIRYPSNKRASKPAITTDNPAANTNGNFTGLVPTDYNSLTVEQLIGPAEKGNRIAQLILGVRFLKGDYVPKNVTEGLHWLTLAANNGLLYAQSGLAFFYESGGWFGDSDLIPPNYQEAARFYLKAAEQGESISQWRLGVLCEFGRGTPQDKDEAFKWYSKSAAQGVIQAQGRLGMLYHSRKDYSDALKWFRRAANNGDVLAQWYMGYMFKNGEGVSQTYPDAAKWFRRAANQGYFPAQYDLGCLYFGGLGTASAFRNRLASTKGCDGVQSL